jgi:hypothetical protein
MVLRIVQRSGSLDMTQRIGEFTRPHACGADDAMGNTQRRRVIMPFGLGEELHGYILLLGDIASDMVECPYCVEDREFLWDAQPFADIRWLPR